MNPMTLILLGAMALLIIFMFYNSRKRQKAQAELREKIVPGAEVMTNFGLYGKLLSIDEDDNTALVETTPGTIVKLHRQAIARVVEETEPSQPEHDTLEPEPEPAEHDEPTGEPEYGERIDDSGDDEARVDNVKPESGKKADE